jgi:hypothetical protein
MRQGARLLLVERLLPGREGIPSPAVAWDVHMLCTVGGRERDEHRYRRLLAATGFELTACHGLPLGASLLHAVRGDTLR